MESNTGQVINLGSLYERLEGLKDKRKAKGKRYALATILIAQVLGLKRASMPSHHTYRGTIADHVDVEEFEALACQHQRRSGKAGYQMVVAMDGKILRGTIDLDARAGLCLLALYLPGEGITLAQLAIADKQSEVSAAPAQLDRFA